MDRLFLNSEKGIWENKLKNDAIFVRERNVNAYRNRDLEHFIPYQKYMYPQDILLAQYKYNGETGKLRYTKDTSKKTDYILLNKYGDEYEEGRNILLWNTVNKNNVKVSSYDVRNSSIPRVYTSATEKLLIK